MKKCLVCERRMLSDNHFGKNCLKQMYHAIGIYDSKCVKTESMLNEEILKLCNNKDLPEEQTLLLMDRYLTLSLLEYVKIAAYEKYKTALQNDIDAIDEKTTKDNLASFDKITLKQAYDLYKKYIKHEEFFEKLSSSYYNDWQNLSFDVVRFAFSKYYATKSYLYDAVQLAQLGILQGGVVFLKLKECDLAAILLEHSLEPNPKDIIITDKYDFTKLQKLNEYFGNGWFGFAAATGNNLAMFSTSCKVVHTYYVTIKFTIKDWK